MTDGENCKHKSLLAYNTEHEAKYYICPGCDGLFEAIKSPKKSVFESGLLGKSEAQIKEELLNK